MGRKLVGEQDVTLRRFGAGTRDSFGAFVPGATVDTVIKASVQPMRGQELAILPEGERQKDQRKVYTLTELRTADQSLQAPPDQLLIDGLAYQVQQVEPWPSVSPLPHFKARVVRLQEVTP